MFRRALTRLAAALILLSGFPAHAAAPGLLPARAPVVAQITQAPFRTIQVLPGMTNFYAEWLPHALPAMQQVRNGNASMFVPIVGESTTLSANQQGPNSQSSSLGDAADVLGNGNIYGVAAQTVGILKAMNISASYDAWFGENYVQNFGSSTGNARIALANPNLTFSAVDSGWVADGVSNLTHATAGGQAIGNTVDTTSTFTYTNRSTETDCNVYYERNTAGQGKVQFSIDGGAFGAANDTNGSPAGTGFFAVHLGSSAIHTLTVRNQTLGTGVWIAGMICYDTTTPRIVLVPMGAQSWRLNVQWLTRTQAWQPLNALASLNAPLILTNEDVNDWKGAVTATQQVQNWNIFLGFVRKGYTDVIHVLPQNVCNGTTECNAALAYAGALPAYFSNARVPYVTLWNDYPTQTLWNNAGLGSSQTLYHQTLLGSNYIANRYAQIIQALYNHAANTQNPTFTASWLIVGGGAGGGSATAGHNGGGGGPGGLIAGSGVLGTGMHYPVIVGAGGAADTAGTDSCFNTLCARGGGFGGSTGNGGSASASSDSFATVPAGSGGGGGLSGAGGSGFTAQNQGFAGGSGTALTGGNQASGAGGGSSGVGANAASNTAGGNGGPGTSSSITGSADVYAEGGGGGTSGGGTPGTGGTHAGAGSSTGAGAAAAANFGGGGGGAGGLTIAVGGLGGSGTVIISRPTAACACTGGNSTVISGGNTIHIFTTSGELVVP